MIKATVPGKLGKDAETKSVGSTSVTEFSVASDDRVKVDGTYQKVTTWVRCALWGKRGETLAQYLKKGSAVTVFGTLRLREYTKDGEKRISVEMECDDVALQGGSRSAEDKSGGSYDRPSGNGTGDFGGGGFDDGDIPFRHFDERIA